MQCTLQRTALRCYLRRLALYARPPQPPKIGFVDNLYASANPAAETISDLAQSRERPRNRFTAADFHRAALVFLLSRLGNSCKYDCPRLGVGWCYLLVAQKVTYIFQEFGRQPAENANECGTSCGPPRGEGCGPRGSANCILLMNVYFCNLHSCAAWEHSILKE